MDSNTPIPKRFDPTDTVASTDDLYPGFTEAVARENHIRGAACLGWHERVCGCDVLPLTAFHIRRLTYARSPFLARVTAEQLCENPEHHADLLHHAMNFLWTISPMFSEDVGRSTPSAPSRWFPTFTDLWQTFLAGFRYDETQRDKFNVAFSGIMTMDLLIVCRELLNYVDEAYIDAEPSTIDVDPSTYCAFEIQIAEELHQASPREFRLAFWNADCPRLENPIPVPIKLIFGMRKARRQAKGETVTNRSDRLKSEGLALLGKQLRERGQN